MPCQHSPASFVRFLAFLASVILPSAILAQAGSRPALQYDTAFAYNAAGLDVGQSGYADMSPMVPEQVWRLPESSAHLLWVELDRGRLNVLERARDGSLRPRLRIPVSIGRLGIGKRLEGDRKTPIGVYRLTRFLDDARLDDFYGTGAWPLNYPNPIDRRLGRTGHGIWLHGLPKDVAERPFLDSEGCVVIDNESLARIDPFIDPGHTTIMLSPRPLNWVSLREQERRRAPLERALRDWVAAWEALDTGRYLDFYAADFTDQHHDKAAWSAYKAQVNAGKTFVHVTLSDISMLADPLVPEHVTVRFHQDYASDNHAWQGWKEQVWRLGDAGWQIVYEGEG